MKHTPGPWNFAPTGSAMQGYSQPFGIVQLGAPNLVAGVFGDVKGGEEVAEANARLIATAPELLEAAKALVAQVEREGGAAMTYPPYKARFDALLAAIAKAEAK